MVEKKEVKKEKFEVKEEKKDLKPKLGLFTQIKSAFTNKVTITEKETEPVFADLEIALLESDVSFDTAQFLIADLKKRLVGKQVGKNELQTSIQEEIKNSFEEILKQSENTSFITELRKASKPVKILFLGPNGAGKTTTIAKLSYLLKQEGLTSVISASDTFRAAAIEQASIHGEKLGVKVVKHQYGSDPSAVAFDAIEHAKSKSIDVVLIDTAGRQETNQNLLREMEKINRVVKPDYKIFIGEAIAGHAVIEQAKAFHEKVKLDGVILTKLDCDAKGGTSLSLAHDLNVPILFIGLGQEYSDLKEFDADFILKNIVE
ncbi:signal recognition particle-docking protein FtsY [Candidatus Micrarchaeota archaeon]|nr:signal recognition particle-docking protein FtsY [Candidatus Micrarchaeota archaeon]